MKKNIAIYEGKVEEDGWKDDVLRIDDDNILSIFWGWKGKNIRITIEEIPAE